MAFGDLMVMFGKVVKTTVSGVHKAILLNMSFLDIDDETSADTDREPLFGMPGYYCRPKSSVKKADATGINPEGHTEVIALSLGDEMVPLEFRDLRLNGQINPKEGELGLIQYGGGFISLADNADGDGTSITIYALRKKADGSADKAHVIAIDSSKDNTSIAIVHENGQTISLTKDGNIVLMNKAGDAYIDINDAGVTVNAAQIVLTGGVVMGDKNPALTDFFVKSTELLAWIAEVNTALGVIASVAGNDFNPAITPPATVPIPTTLTKGA